MSKSKSILEELFPHEDEKNISVKAKKKAEQIIKHAIKEAHSIVTQTTFFHKDLKNSLKDELKIALDNSIVLFRDELSKQTTLITNEFCKAIQNELHLMHDNVQKQAAQELNKIEEELVEYKKKKQGTIDNDIAEMLKKELQDVLHTELPENVKQQLIIKALERAKKNGFFNNS